MKPRIRLLAALSTLALMAVACSAQPQGDLETGDTDVAADDDDASDGGGGDDDDTADDGIDDDNDDNDTAEDDNDTADTGDGQHVTIVGAQPDSLDPTTYATAGSSQIIDTFCEALYAYDFDAEVSPLLAAEEPEFSDDALTVTIPIREDVQFNDGTDLDAEAVVTSLDRHLNHPESGRAGELSLIESMEAIDDMTVEIQLSEPFTPLVAALAGPSGRIMSPTQLEELGDDFGDDPICVGPFEFSERPDQGLVVVTRAENYYRADEVGMDQLTFTTIEDNAVAVNNLLAGEVDLTTVAPVNIDRVEGEDGLQFLTTEGLGYQGLTINLGLEGSRDDPLGDPGTVMSSDPRIREAFELSLDRDEINDLVYQGMHVVGCSPIPPASPFAAASPECPGQDLERAQQLLEEAGVDTPVPVDLTVSSTPDAQRTGELIQAMAGEAGFDVSVQAMEATTAIDQGVAGDFDTWLIGFGTGPEPDGGIYRFHHTEGGTNAAGIGLGETDGDIDAALDAARQTDDIDERIAAYSEALALIGERRNIIFLYHPSHFVGANADLEGTELLPGGMADFSRLRWSE